jgi:hypothetical protein
MKKVWIYLFFHSIWVAIGAQTDTNLSLNFHEIHAMRGFVIPHHDDMYHVYRPTHAIQYQKLHAIERSNDRYGYQVFAADLGSSTLGWSLSTSLIFEKNIWKYNRTQLVTGLAMGVGYISNPFHIIDNPHNRAIGSYTNAFGQLSFGTRTVWSNGIGLNVNFRFSHFSNGGAKAPNLGINIPSVSVGLSKGIPQKLEHLCNWNLSPKVWHRFASLRYGFKNTDIDDPRVFGVWVLEGGYSYRHTQNSSFRLGLSIHEDPTYRLEKLQPLKSFNGKNGIELGVFIGYQYRMDAWTMFVDAGAYVYKPIPSMKTAYFEALGLRYKWNQHWEILGRLRANKAKADVIEWGFIYTWD